jgi:hypothetical protein
MKKLQNFKQETGNFNITVAIYMEKIILTLTSKYFASITAVEAILMTGCQTDEGTPQWCRGLLESRWRNNTRPWRDLWPRHKLTRKTVDVIL